jgi:sporulation protein YlmC with PRC-barrel domain
MIAPANGRSLRDAALLGYRLSQAHGFDVITSDGRKLGRLQRLRYERHAEYPEELIVHRGRLLWKRDQHIPFHRVEHVEPRARLIRLLPE